MRFARFIGIGSERWQLIAIVIVTVLFLAGCSPTSTPPLRVTLPPLPAQVVQPCPLPSPLPDGEIPTLISALMDSWAATAECEIKRRGAVDAYEAARAVNNAPGP